MRKVLLAIVTVVACTDIREYEGAWQGPRVGDTPALRVGVAGDAQASLRIESVDKHGITGRLTVDGLVDDAPIASVEGAEADVLAGLTFTGSPRRVYLAFAETTDGGGSALAVIAIYDDDRVEVRLLRGGATPLYGIFVLRPE